MMKTHLLERVGIAIGAILVTPTVGVAHEPFAPTNAYQERCLQALAPLERTTGYYGGMPTFHFWSKGQIAEGGSARFEDQRRQKEDLVHRIQLLQPGIRTGHLPTLSLMANRFFHPQITTESFTAEQRYEVEQVLLDSGFPVVAPRFVYQAMGFQPKGPDGAPLPASEGLPQGEAEQAAAREKYLEITRWVAVRGSSLHWSKLAIIYYAYAKEFGGTEYRIEAHAWNELEAQLSTSEGEFPHRSRGRQEELEGMFESKCEFDEARRLGGEYVKNLMPRRLVFTDGRDICRLRPQFRGELDPYGYETNPALRARR